MSLTSLFKDYCKPTTPQWYQTISGQTVSQQIHKKIINCIWTAYTKVELNQFAVRHCLK